MATMSAETKRELATLSRKASTVGRKWRKESYVVWAEADDLVRDVGRLLDHNLSPNIRAVFEQILEYSNQAVEEWYSDDVVVWPSWIAGCIRRAGIKAEE